MLCVFSIYSIHGWVNKQNPQNLVFRKNNHFTYLLIVCCCCAFPLIQFIHRTAISSWLEWHLIVGKVLTRGVNQVLSASWFSSLNFAENNIKNSLLNRNYQQNSLSTYFLKQHYERCKWNGSNFYWIKNQNPFTTRCPLMEC